ncbi:hypothetical protein DFP93_10516 [Aneurinibacillus soli]|uniref:Uncharacterized protein n=1 Tax=Aneurinibacillus soli TaxID=1500254 RepID=A0A0U4WJP1_9BACL|nr:hypothetical protein DFP93_10516 [Aneurinibacillus soli]BAU28747.1 hypothetical protein CB4_02922 [Aneurinibacillus soli]
MNDFNHFIGKHVDIEVSGKNYYKGTLIDAGLDIIVVYDHSTLSFLYIPIEKPIESDSASISFRKALANAKGQFV